MQSPSDTIFCRHLSLKYALDSLRNGKGKVNLIKHYSSVESIQQHVSLVRDAEFRALLRHPPARSRVIASQDFGFALDIFFCRMMANNVSHMSAILYIDNHTLSVSKDVVLSYISTLGTFEKKYSFSQRQLFTLLAAKNHDNMLAVHIAIHHNHHKTVETYYAAINVISQSLSFSADELKTYL